LKSHWSREREGYRQGFIYLDELKESIFLSQDLGSDLAFSPQTTPAVLNPHTIAPQTDGHDAGILQDNPYGSDVKKNDQAGQGDGKVDISGTRSILLWSRRGIVGIGKLTVEGKRQTQCRQQQRQTEPRTWLLGLHLEYRNLAD
jgi:hypothetical protein